MEQAIIQAAQSKFGQVIETQANVLLIKRTENDYMTIKAGLVDGEAQFNFGNYNMSLIEAALDLRDRATNTRTMSHTTYVVKFPASDYSMADVERVEKENMRLDQVNKYFDDVLIQPLEDFQFQFNVTTDEIDGIEVEDYFIAFINEPNAGSMPA